MDSIAQVLEIVAVILLLGAVGEFVFSCTGIPDVLWLVCAGIPGADAQAFVTDQSARAVQGQMSFLIKSFFFVLIGLMFPTSPRLILLGAVPVLFLVTARIPAVRLATLGLGLSKKQSWLLTLAVPRGLSAGGLSAIPVHYGIAGPDFPPAIFSLIVTSILVFCLGVALIGRMSDEAETSA